MSATTSNNLPLWVQDRETVIAASGDAQWRGNQAPDYAESVENLKTESLKNHPAGSLEDLVQNLVRTFEMEASFKTNPDQWLSVVNEKFRMSSNGGEEFTAQDVSDGGTYNLFIGDMEQYKASEETFESSGRLFRSAFPKGFLWEVLEVYSGPPNVTFKWRHWGTFNGPYKDYAPTGEVVEVIGMSLARVSDDLKVVSLEHYFDNTKFFDKLTSGGTISTHKPKNYLWGIWKKLWGSSEKPATQQLASTGCPFKKLAAFTNGNGA
ncbi:MAG: SnoaL-like polyketide cyclase [Rivularia sp. (in: Bacteria)]|nr:SnoaL-like polyketide cyclase [Rivularia sp. MS3]